jgi:glutamate racemase
MLRTISARSLRPANVNHGAGGNRRRPLIGTSIRDWLSPSAFPNLPRPLHRQALRSSHGARTSFRPGPKGYIHPEIREDIVVAGKVFPPPEPQAFASKAGEYKAAARSLIARAGELITAPPQTGLHDLSRKIVTDNLLQAVHTIAHAGKVMIVTGRNTTDGKVTIDGPVSAALAAHALYKSRKVAVILCDSINQKLIRRLLDLINPDCARYIKYLPVNEVNGKLFAALSRHIVTQDPDVTLYIDVPGRNGSGHYFDEHGKSIGMANVAFDQALNIQNSLGKETIAICRSANNAGMAATETPVLADGEDIRAGLASVLPLLVSDVVDGTVTLMELVSNACTDMNAFTPEQMKGLLEKAIDITEDKAFTAPAMRRIGKPLEPRSDGGRVTVESRTYNVSNLQKLQKLVDARPIIWPAWLEKLKIEGPETRYAVLYDSSDGVFIATDDFLGFVRARSQMHLKVHLVADHNKASYGKWCEKELFHIVVNGMVFSAMRGPDVITLVCNTACTVDLMNQVKAIIERSLKNAGKSTRVEIVDLISTVAQAIVDEGGSRPVLLSTEGTAKSGKYNATMKRIAHDQDIEEPDIQVIGCGDEVNRPGHDLAALITDKAHLEPGTANYLRLLREVRRYCEEISLNATSIWLCCTHFPAIREMIRGIMNERLLAHGMPADSIPIIDPIQFQAEATVAALRKSRPSLKDYNKIPDISVSTTGLPGSVMTKVQHYIKSHKNVPVFDVVFPHINVAPQNSTQTSHAGSLPHAAI